jgi:hypothetical protein
LKITKTINDILNFENKIAIIDFNLNSIYLMNSSFSTKCVVNSKDRYGFYDINMLKKQYPFLSDQTSKLFIIETMRVGFGIDVRLDMFR